MKNQTISSVLKQHKDLPMSTQLKLAKEIQQKYRDFLFYSFHIPAARDYYLDLFEKKKNERNQTGSVAKLSKQYNSSIYGHNKKMNRKLKSVFKKVQRFLDEDRLEEAIDHLLKTQPNPKVVLCQEFLDRVFSAKNTLFGKKAKEALDDLIANRQELCRSGYKMVHYICKELYPSCQNATFSLEDLFQEGLIFLYESTLTYDPKTHSSTKWTSYAYSKVFRSLQKFISENSTMISFPRVKLSRFLLLNKIVDLSSDTYDFESLAYQANEWLIRNKNQIKESDFFSPKEIENLISTIPMEQSSLDHNTYAVEPSLEKNLDSLPKAIHLVLYETLSPLEYYILTKKWNLVGDFRLTDKEFEQCSQQYLALTTDQILGLEEEALSKLIDKRKDPKFIELLDLLMDS